MTRQTGGQLLVAALLAQGVTEVFGIPGVQLDAAADALHERQDAIHFTCVRNEQAATYLADGYARSSGQVGVAMVVPGPGVLNALAGLATAYATCSPVLLIAGQIRSDQIGQGFGVLHELPDQTGVLERVTGWTGTARRAADIPALVVEAFRRLRSDRPRPVAIEVPPDVLAEVVEDVAVPDRVQQVRTAPPADRVVEAARLLLAAERPLLYVGGGIRASDASAELVALAEAIEAPVLVSENGRGAIDARHRLALDSLALRTLRADADLVLAVGSRFVSTFGTRMDTAGAPVLLVNSEPAHLGGVREPRLALQGDARATLAALLAEVRAQARVGAAGAPFRPSRQDEIDRARAWVAGRLAEIAPQQEYLAALRSVLPADAVLVSEYTQIGYAASMSLPTYHARGYLGPGYQGTLGYGFATALGAQTADPDRAVVSVNGDGGFSWTLPELSTAKRYGLAVVVIVFRDGYYGNVRRIQRDSYGGRVFASDLTNPDYPALAAAFGIRSVTVWDPAQLATAVAEGIAAREPVLIEVPVGEFPSPWHLIHEGLATPAPLAPGADRLAPPA
ncbi:MAG TPA: thiamine pyrophosphate-binding protein [Cellulomonas sp.]